MLLTALRLTNATTYWSGNMRESAQRCCSPDVAAILFKWNKSLLFQIEKRDYGPQIWHLTDFSSCTRCKQDRSPVCVPFPSFHPPPTFCHIAWEKSSFCLHECRRDGTRGIRTKRWLFRASHIRQNNIQHLIVRGAGFPIRSTWRLEQFAVCAAEIASRKRRPFGRRAETMSSLSRHVRLFCREFKGCGWNNWKWVSEKVKKKKTSPSYMTYMKYIT